MFGATTRCIEQPPSSLPQRQIEKQSGKTVGFVLDFWVELSSFSTGLTWCRTYPCFVKLRVNTLESTDIQNITSRGFPRSLFNSLACSDSGGAEMTLLGWRASQLAACVAFTHK